MAILPVGTAQHVAQITRICQLVPSTVVLYDHIITFDMEVDLVWNKPRTFAKILFTLNRYFGTILLFTSAILFIITPPSDEATAFLFYRDGPLPFYYAIMLCRTFAIYKQNKVIMTVCLACYVAQIAAMSAILAATQQALEPQMFSAPGVFICTPRKISRFYRAVWISPIIFDCANLALSMAAFFRRSPQLRGVVIMTNPMWKVLRDDTLKFYIVVLTVSIANATVWFVFPPEWLKLLQGFFTAAICVMGGRLVLSFRVAYYRSSPNDSDEFDNEETIIQRVAFSQHSVGLIPLQEMNPRGDRERQRQSSECFEVPPPLTTLDKIIGIT